MLNGSVPAILESHFPGFFKECFHESPGQTVPLHLATNAFIFYMIDKDKNGFMDFSVKCLKDIYSFDVSHGVISLWHMQTTMEKYVGTLLHETGILMLNSTKQTFLLHTRLDFPPLPKNTCLENYGYGEHGQSILSIDPEA